MIPAFCPPLIRGRVAGRDRARRQEDVTDKEDNEIGRDLREAVANFRRALTRIRLAADRAAASARRCSPHKSPRKVHPSLPR
jgi:hypothetical protein